MAVKVLRRTIVPKPVEEVIREMREEGWCPIVVKSDGAVFKISDSMLVRVSKNREN